jgi:hypothetical protein
MHKNDQSVIVRHKEFIGEVTSSIDYNVQYQLELNPGVAATFPWLSNIAKNYQEYRFKGVIFHYVPTSGSAIASTNNALGSVMMQTSYRATDAAPDTKREILNEYWSTETVPSETTCHPIECNPAENPFNVQYVRQTVVPTGDNLLLYDLGRTYIATSGQQSNGVVLGDLWVTYEVELKKPTLYSNVTSYGTSVTTFATPASTTVKAGVYMDSTTVVRHAMAGNINATGNSRTITIPDRFEGWIFVLCRLESPTPWIESSSVQWSTAFTLNGPLIQADLLGDTSRWDTVNEVGAGYCRSMHLMGSFEKTNSTGAAAASIVVPQCIFLAGGSANVEFQATVILVSTVV